MLNYCKEACRQTEGFNQRMMVQTYLQTTWPTVFTCGVVRVRFRVLCVGAEALASLGIHLCLALASESAATTCVGLDNTQSLELLKRVADETARCLRAAARLHAAALAAAIDLPEFAGSNSPSDVDLARDRSCSREKGIMQSCR